MVNVQVDGVWKKFPKGTRLIEACREAGSEVPHYCYHPKLSSPGNCRMCLIEMGMPGRPAPGQEPKLDEHGFPEISWIPRPQISCAQTISEGMGVRTNSPMVQDCRNGVMELLLINHPLDCPICDQAGECKLQEFSVEYGKGESRFLEEKVHKPKNVDLGPRIVLDDERCVLCSRCVRFSQEIAEDDVLGFVNRGSYNTLTAHPGRRFDNNYTLNTVDICPVGALTSKDFRFKMRVWFLKETKSICTGCATGCNTLVATRQEKMYRMTPRDNEAVNECWMCDAGRLDFHYLEAENRFTQPLVIAEGGKLHPQPWKNAISSSAQALLELPKGSVAIVASGRMTNEELFLAKRLAKVLGTEKIDIVPRTWAADHILVSADKNPNTNGAKLLGVCAKEASGRFADLPPEVCNGKIKGLVVLGGEDVTDLGLTAEDLAKLDVLIYVGLLPNATSAAAHVILPGLGFAEKRGSMINIDGRLQRLNRAVNQPPGQATDDWEILRDLIAALGGGNGIYMIEELFKAMAADTPELAGLSLSKIGDLGVPLLGVEAPKRKVGKPVAPEKSANPAA
jgi:NADH-quinone oxidoreductase subunit G